MVYRSTPRTRARKAERRAAILSAARDLVAEGDFASLQIRAVAERAGVASGTVYRYFPSKTELSLAVFRLVSGRELAVLEAIVSERSEGDDVRETLETLVRVFVERALLRPRLAYALLAEPLEEPVAAERLCYRRSYARIFQGVVEVGLARELLPAQDAALSASWVVGALSESLHAPLARATPREVLVPSLTTLALSSLGIAASDLGVQR